MDMRTSPIHGSRLEQNPLVSVPGGLVALPGQFRDRPARLELSEELLSRHTMLIGGTGCGKSNVFYHLLAQLRRRMTDRDVMIVFDTKGDYYRLFAAPGDLQVGCRPLAGPAAPVSWNLFREALADGWEDRALEQSVQELSWSVFRESIEKSKDPFFPNAARDLFAAVLLCLL